MLPRVGEDDDALAGDGILEHGARRGVHPRSIQPRPVARSNSARSTLRLGLGLAPTTASVAAGDRLLRGDVNGIVARRSHVARAAERAEGISPNVQLGDKFVQSQEFVQSQMMML